MLMIRDMLYGELKKYIQKCDPCFVIVDKEKKQIVLDWQFWTYVAETTAIYSKKHVERLSKCFSGRVYVREEEYLGYEMVWSYTEDEERIKEIAKDIASIIRMVRNLSNWGGYDN